MDISYRITEKKLCYIINNETFNKSLKFPVRKGTNIDFANLERLFTDLNFTVESHKNVKGANIKNNLEEISKREDLKYYSMFVCIILSYGDENVIYGTDGSVKIDHLMEHFKGDVCEALRGKPKLFFVQACHDERTYQDVMETDANPLHIMKRIPVEADFLFGLCTVPGYLSWDHDATCGSWYIQALCRVLEENWETEDMMHILLKVNAVVAEKFLFSAGDSKTDKMAQIPTFTCMLRKKLYLVRNRQ